MALDVTVKIDLTNPVGNVGTWFPLLYVVDAEATSDVYAEYTELSEIAKDYPATTVEGVTTPSAVYTAATVLFKQNNAPRKIAVLKQAAFVGAETFAKYLSYGFRQIILVGEHSNVKAIADYVEAIRRMLFVTVPYAEVSTLAETLKANTRTVLVIGEADEACAVVGATAGLEAGSFTYKNMIVKAEAINEVTNDITNVKGIAIVEKAGDIVTAEGKTVSGEYIDIVDSEDYVIQNIEYAVQKIFNNNNKVPYTNEGIAMLEAATLGVLVDAFNKGMIATDDEGKPDYSVDFAMRSETTETDRAARNYPYGKFRFALAGAIHTAEINGTITV